MKRWISLLLVTIICCSMLLPSAQGAEADPDYMYKLDSYLIEQMEKAPDNAKIPIDISLATPSEEEILAQIDVPVPGAGATLEEVNAYNSAMRQAKRAVYSAITSAFVEDYLDENDTVRVRGSYIPTLIVEVPKSKVLSLAALEEVTHVGWADSYTIIYPMDPVTPDSPEEPDYMKKLDPYLLEQLEKAPDNAKIPIDVTLATPSEEEILAQIDVPAPGAGATLEEVNAYNAAMRRAKRAVYSAITSAFAEDHLDENDTVRFRGNYIPTLIIEVPKPKVLSLASQEEVTHVGWADGYTILYPMDPATPDPPEDPDYSSKLDPYLIEQMEKEPDDAFIPISILLEGPSQEKIKEMLPIPEPDIHSNVTLEEVEAYISAKRELSRELYSAITNAFVQEHLDENDTIRFCGRYIPSVTVEVPKQKVYTLAALENVTSISWADRNTSVYPTVPLWPNLPAEYEKKITQALKDYATPLPDDTHIPVRFDLRDPDESLIERMVSATVPKPGEDASQEEIDAYNAAYREKWREQISVRTGAFVNYRLEETETVYYIGEDTAVVICEVPKSRIAYLASMDEVLQIDLAGSYLDPLPCEHDYQAVVTAPTCTEGGYTTYTCSKCGDSYTGSETAALGHSYRTAVTPPTCTEPGFTTYTCTRCGDSYTGSETAALGHSYRTVVTPSTCTEPGFTTYTCTRCGDTYTGSETAALGHSYRAVVTPSTCTEPGFTTYTCTRCGDKYTDAETAALNHDWGEGVVTRQPTETSTGVRTYTCTRCAEKRTEVIPMLTHVHSYTATVTPPTCTEAGFTTHTCACGDSYVDSTVPALGHSFGDWTVSEAVTCTEAGSEIRTCIRCDAKETREIAALGHDYKAVVTAPTCTEAGFTTHTCTRCGSNYTDSTTAALGHDWGEGAVTVEPTETETGERTFTCARCGEKKTESIPVKEHVHNYIEAKTLPTCTEEGYSVFTCTCGRSYKDDEVPALGHDFQDGVCTRCGAKDPEYVPPVVDPFRFDDVKDDALFYYEPVYWAVEQKITKGTSEKLFSPDDGCTRGQVVTFLWRAAGEPEPTKAKNPFQDVKETDYFYKAVLWAVEKGITKGTSADKFSPDATCTRGQIVTFLYRAEGTPEIAKKSKPFHDVDEGQYYADAVAWAVENGITIGKSPETFAPNATCTRGEVVTFLYRSSKE